MTPLLPRRVLRTLNGAGPNLRPRLATLSPRFWLRRAVKDTFLQPKAQKRIRVATAYENQVRLNVSTSTNFESNMILLGELNGFS